NGADCFGCATWIGVVAMDQLVWIKGKKQLSGPQPGKGFFIGESGQDLFGARSESQRSSRNGTGALALDFLCAHGQVDRASRRGTDRDVIDGCRGGRSSRWRLHSRVHSARLWEPSCGSWIGSAKCASSRDQQDLCEFREIHVPRLLPKLRTPIRTCAEIKV